VVVVGHLGAERRGGLDAPVHADVGELLAQLGQLGRRGGGVQADDQAVPDQAA
jgi:hypothetical protein